MRMLKAGLLCAVLILSAGALLVAEEVVHKAELLIVNEYCVDGTVKTSEYRISNGRKIKIRPAADDKRSFASAVNQRIYRWEAGVSKVVYDFTELTLPHKKTIKKIIKNYIKKRRGNGNVPVPKLKTTVMPVKDISEFGNNLFEYQRQFHNDDHNTLVMTSDDLFFKNVFGQLNDPRVVIRTETYSVAQITKSGGKYKGTYYLEEADIFLRSDFFGMPKFNQESSFTSAFRFGNGMQKNIMGFDVNAAWKSFTEAMFNDAKSVTWTKFAQPYDDMMYKDKIKGIYPAGYLSAPVMLPSNSAVMDFRDYKVPDTDPSNPSPTSNMDPLVITNLLTFDNTKRKLIVEFTAIYSSSVSPSKKIKDEFLTIEGNAYDYPRTFSLNGTSTNWYPSIILNTVGLGHQGDLDKINQYINDHGTPMTLEGVDFAKALKVEMKVTGYLKENGGKKSLSRTVYFVNTTP